MTEQEFERRLEQILKDHNKGILEAERSKTLEPINKGIEAYSQTIETLRAIKSLFNEYKANTK